MFVGAHPTLSGSLLKLQSLLKPQDVFASSLYTGNGATQFITTNVDLTQGGGLVWLKTRDQSASHMLTDTVRGVAKTLSTDNGSQEVDLGTSNGIQSFTSNGFNLGPSYFGENTSGYSCEALTFRRSAKFFDIVTYTGDGTIGRQILHGLGMAPGMIILKRRDANAPWAVYHRSNTFGSGLTINSNSGSNADQTTAFAIEDASTGASAPTSTNFRILATGSATSSWNATGGLYVAYLFAHDPDPSNGIIQCGGYTGNGSSQPITLGWQPQYLLLKRTDTASNWMVINTTRGKTSNNNFPTLYPNQTSVETSADTWGVDFSTTGISIQQDTAGNWCVNGGTYVYMAIRAPFFLGATRPQDVFGAITYTGTAVTTVNLPFTSDFVWEKPRGSGSHWWYDSVRGTGKVLNISNDAEQDFGSNGANGAQILTKSYKSISWSANSSIASWPFRRAPKFFDIITYTGDGQPDRVLPHSLGAFPAMIIFKALNTTGKVAVFHQQYAYSTGESLTGGELSENTPFGSTTTDGVGLKSRSASTISLRGAPSSVSLRFNPNSAGTTYVAYLFAHDPDPVNGIIQCGLFSQNVQQVNLGWSPQFLMFRAASQTGSWYIMDTTRGFPIALYPNSTVGESTANGISVNNLGFYNSGFFGGSTPVIYLAIRSALM